MAKGTSDGKRLKIAVAFYQELWDEVSAYAAQRKISFAKAARTLIARGLEKASK